MISEQLQELAALHALGALTPEEARDFETQLSRDAELRAFYASMQNVTGSLALNVKDAVPSAQLKNRIMAAIAEPVPQKVVSLPHTERNFFAIFLPWAVAACFAVVGGILTLENEKAAFANRQANKKIIMLESAIDDLKAKDHVSQVQIAMMSSLLENSPKAVAVSVWDAEKQDGVLVVSGLAPLPADKDYQLWVVDPKIANPVDAGVFSVDDKGAVHFHFKPKSSVSGVGTFAVSLEKKGGVPKAEGPMVLAGHVM